MEQRDNRTINRLAAACLVAAIAVGAALAVTPAAPAQDPEAIQSRIDSSRAELEQKKQKLAQARERAGVLSSQLDRLGDRVDQLSGEVATLRNREAAVKQDLAETKAQLERAKHQYKVLRVRLQRSLKVLRERLVSIYKTDEPDALTVLLDSHGFDDMLARYEYLTSIEEQDSEIVGRVRDLRNQAKQTVHTIRAAKEEIQAKKNELVRTRTQLEARQAELETVQGQQQAALQETRQQSSVLEGDVSGLEDQIASQLQAQAEAQAAAAGPVPGGTATGPPSSSGFIWPVNGPITSPFCEPRPWEACHPGIDIGVPSGTPVHAAASGTVAIAAPTGGYGNYICINHGGGLSSCYAHLASFSVGVGQSVSQGQVVGISDCTGLCFGPHLHFEVRVNGSVVDPMGYL
jgi:murein DD-endopeptidase MepM/ murein hydrolase activator NlpD